MRNLLFLEVTQKEVEPPIYPLPLYLGGGADVVFRFFVLGSITSLACGVDIKAAPPLKFHKNVNFSFRTALCLGQEEFVGTI